MAACDKFISTEILKQAPEQKALHAVALPDLKSMLLAALQAVGREDGWASLSVLGSQLTKNHPSFDQRMYGYAKLSDMVRKEPHLELREVAGGDASSIHTTFGVDQAPDRFF